MNNRSRQRKRETMSFCTLCNGRGFLVYRSGSSPITAECSICSGFGYVVPAEEPRSPFSGMVRVLAVFFGIVAVVIVVLAVIVVMRVRDGELVVSVSVDAPTAVAAEATAIPRPTVAATPTPAPTASQTETPISALTPIPIAFNVHDLYLESATGIAPADLATAREYALQLINEARAAHGLNPVTLDENPTAQYHAVDMRANCTMGHWGTDGLKPYMRYTLLGGTQYSGENVSGSYYCPRDPERYRVTTIRAEIEESMDGLMNSPGHRDNILDRLHKKVGIGIAAQHPGFWLTQLFVGDYIEYAEPPRVTRGQLSFAGRVAYGVVIATEDAFDVQIDYDPPPGEVTRGQIFASSCYSGGELVAALRPPLTGTWYYTEHEWNGRSTRCQNAAEFPIDSPSPTRHSADQSRELVEYSFSAQWITASVWQVRDDVFRVSADINDVLRRHGDGVYTVNVFGEIDREFTLISQYAIFVPPYTLEAPQPTAR